MNEMAFYYMMIRLY